MFFHMYLAQGQGQTTFVDKILMSTQRPCHFAHLLQSSKKHFEVWFYTYFCLILYMYLAPRQGQTTAWGQNFYFNINLLSLWSFAVSFFH